MVRLLGLLVLAGATGAAPAQAQEPAPDPALDTLRNEPLPAPAPPDSVEASDLGAADTTERAFVTADSLSALVRDGERLQELFDNVFVRQDTTRLRSNFALRYLNREELLFTDEVVIFERGDTLRADTVRYNKRTQVGRARGNVRLTDGEVLVRAPRATYFTDEKRSVFPDSVTLIDSSRVLGAQSGTYWSDERRAEFQGEVRLTDPDTYLESDSLTYYRDQERSIAKGRVFIRRVEEDTASVDSASTAAPDTTARTYLFGDWVDNQEQNRYSRVEGNALLVRVRRDSAGAPKDTFAVRARQLEARRTDTYRRLVAVDSVRIWQADLAAVADSAVYDRVIAPGRADTAQVPSALPDSAGGATEPPVEYDTVADSLVAETNPPALSSPVDEPRSAPKQPSPDSGTTADAEAGPPDDRSSLPSDSLRPPESRAQESPLPDSGRAEGRRPSARAGPQRAWERPVASDSADVPLEETRLFKAPITWFERAQVWGDSIRVRAHERSLDTVFVRGAAFAAQEDTTIDRIQQLKGKDITAFFRRDSLRRIRAQPNAQAIRFMTTSEGALKGAAKASGDRIVLRFRQGTVRRISVIGGVQSTYYRKPDNIPSPFRLQGFQWTPERKPTKRGLLRTPRVRERLDLDKVDEAARPPLAQQPDGPAADSLRARRDRAGRSGTEQGAAQTGLLDRLPSDSLATPPDSLQSTPPLRPAADTSETSSEPDS